MDRVMDLQVNPKAPRNSVSSPAVSHTPSCNYVARANLQPLEDPQGALKSALRTLTNAKLTSESWQPDCEALANMTATATLIAAAALMRRESRGAHFRSDYPQADGATGTRSLMTLKDALAIRDTTTRKEPA